MYNNWLQKLTESYTQAKVELTESEMILEELNETKEYAYILEHVLNTLLEHEVINEEIIMEALSPYERLTQAERMGLDDDEAHKRYMARHQRLSGIQQAANKLLGKSGTRLRKTDPMTVNQAKRIHANDILRASDFPDPTPHQTRAIDRRVPEGSPEESDIIHTGLLDAGINTGSFTAQMHYPQLKGDALNNMRYMRAERRKSNALLKRLAREREQREQG